MADAAGTGVDQHSLARLAPGTQMQCFPGCLAYERQCSGRRVNHGRWLAGCAASVDCYVVWIRVVVVQGSCRKNKKTCFRLLLARSASHVDAAVFFAFV